MRATLTSLVERLKTSLWLYPLVGVFLAMALSSVTIFIDHKMPIKVLDTFITQDGESARSVLTVVATSMLTFTALVFTITMVVLQLAGSQYSPRITRAFLREPQTKLTMAVFMSTFLFALCALRAVRTRETHFVPNLSVLVTYLFVLSSLLIFIRYLNHMAQSIRVGNIVARLGTTGASLYETRLPRGAHCSIAPLQHAPSHKVAWPGPPAHVTFIDTEGLAEKAGVLGTDISVTVRVGDFLTHGQNFAELSGATCSTDPKELARYFGVGQDRTHQQDLALPLRHLVDIALRALSPGINDPTTAIESINYLDDLLRRLARADWPTRQRLQAQTGRGSVILTHPSFEDLLAVALDELEQAASEQVVVIRRVRDMLDDLQGLAPAHRRPGLQRRSAVWRRLASPQVLLPTAQKATA